jgi:hypothetical protein
MALLTALIFVPTRPDHLLSKDAPIVIMIISQTRMITVPMLQDSLNTKVARFLIQIKMVSTMKMISARW